MRRFISFSFAVLFLAMVSGCDTSPSSSTESSLGERITWVYEGGIDRITTEGDSLSYTDKNGVSKKITGLSLPRDITASISDQTSGEVSPDEIIIDWIVNGDRVYAFVFSLYDVDYHEKTKKYTPTGIRKLMIHDDELRADLSVKGKYVYIEQ
jgi:hypothetical protein